MRAVLYIATRSFAGEASSDIGPFSPLDLVGAAERGRRGDGVGGMGGTGGVGWISVHAIFIFLLLYFFFASDGDGCVHGSV